MLDLYIHRVDLGSWDPRDLFPNILELKENGVGIYTQSRTFDQNGEGGANSYL